MPEHASDSRLDELLERARAAVELASKHGADGAWATTSSVRSTNCTVRAGKLETMQQSNSRSLSLEVYVDGRYFTHTTSDLRPSEITGFVKDAVALTRALERDPYRSLPDPALYAGRSDVDLQMYDPAIDALDVDRRVAMCMAADARVTGKPGVISATSATSDTRWEQAAVSSNGFSGTQRGTDVSLSTSVTMRDAGDKRPENGFWVSQRHLADLRDPGEVAELALARAQARLGARKGPTVTTTLVADRMVVPQLVSMLLSPASGSAIQQGRSFWAERRGKPVLARQLEIVDDPLLVRAPSSHAFDGEGIASRRRTVIAGGALQMLFVDTYYARKLGIAPTTGGWSNLVITPGKGDVAALAAAARTGVYVTDWLGGNADDTTGDFSLGLRGHMIENGKIGAPVGEMNATGNLVDLFAHITAIGGDVWTEGWMRAPSLAFAKVSFSGA